MKKIFLYVGGGIVALVLWALSGEIGRFIGRSAMESYVQGRQEGGVEKVLELAVHEIRKQLPMQIDEATTLQNVMSVGNAFYYYYHLSYLKSDIDAEYFREAMTRNLRSNACQHQDMRYAIDMGAEYKYIYMSADGLVIDEITIRASDCSP
jgi:hypothetical protein